MLALAPRKCLAKSMSFVQTHANSVQPLKHNPRVGTILLLVVISAPKHGSTNSTKPICKLLPVSFSFQEMMNMCRESSLSQMLCPYAKLPEKADALQRKPKYLPQLLASL